MLKADFVWRIRIAAECTVSGCLREENWKEGKDKSG